MTSMTTRGRWRAMVIPGALGLMAIYQALCIISIVRLMTSTSGGWVFWETAEGGLRADPVTAAAASVSETRSISSRSTRPGWRTIGT